MGEDRVVYDALLEIDEDRRVELQIVIEPMGQEAADPRDVDPGAILWVVADDTQLRADPCAPVVEPERVAIADILNAKIVALRRALAEKLASRPQRILDVGQQLARPRVLRVGPHGRGQRIDRPVRPAHPELRLGQDNGRFAVVGVLGQN